MKKVEKNVWNIVYFTILFETKRKAENFYIKVQSINWRK